MQHKISHVTENKAHHRRAGAIRRPFFPPLLSDLAKPSHGLGRTLIITVLRCGRKGSFEGCRTKLWAILDIVAFIKILITHRLGL